MRKGKPAGQEDAETRGLSSGEVQTVVNNTVAVMTVAREKREAWREAVQQALTQATSNDLPQEAEFLSAVLSLLEGEEAALPEDHPYAGALEEIYSGIAAGGPEGIGVSAEAMEAVQKFVSAADWAATRRVVEAQQALLFRPEVAALFEQNIAQARREGNQRAVEMLEVHLDLLRTCQAEGIEAAFAKLEAAQERGMPFDDDLVPRAVAALLGGPQEKMAHAQYLHRQAAQSQDEGLLALIEVIQTALFGGDLAELGQDLEGRYRQAWEAIVMRVATEGVDPQLLAAIASNTLAVLGPARHQRGAWREDLASLHRQAEEGGAAQLAALAEAVIALLDAQGDPAGLGEGLEGIYAQTWQAITDQLS